MNEKEMNHLIKIYYTHQQLMIQMQNGNFIKSADIVLDKFKDIKKNLADLGFTFIALKQTNNILIDSVRLKEGLQYNDDFIDPPKNIRLLVEQLSNVYLPFKK